MERYIMNSTDLRAMASRTIGETISEQFDSLKVEGRIRESYVLRVLVRV